MKTSATPPRIVLTMFLIMAFCVPPARADPEQYDWSQLRQLVAGTEILLTIKDGPPARVRLLFADDSTLITSKPGGPTLPRAAERALIAVGHSWPDVSNGDKSFLAGAILVSRRGVFGGQTKLADLGQVVQQTPQEDFKIALESNRNQTRRHVFIVAAIRVVVGLVLPAMLRPRP